MKVGFLGIQCDTANMGLAALTYAGVRITRDAIAGDAEFVFFSVNTISALEGMQQTLGLENTRLKAMPFRHKNPLSLRRCALEMRTCDVICDFTGGDSFSDIYGVARLLRKLFHKQLALASGTPLVLAPQTYGPLKRRITVGWFRHVINRAALVFTRDQLSARFLRTLTNREIHVATDVAVTLPFDRDRYRLPDADRLRIGLNVSGLLWNGGYTGRNQFNLVADYRAYCAEVVGALLGAGHEVHLVPHVLTREWESADEDDVAACRALRAVFPACQLTPLFESPVDAKSYIANMDVFIGSRMHATIAALTAGVPTIPVAYSRKFEGFFANVGYDIVVDLTTQETSAAVASTLSHLAELDVLADRVAAAKETASGRIQIFIDQLGELLVSRPPVAHSAG